MTLRARRVRTTHETDPVRSSRLLVGLALQLRGWGRAGRLLVVVPEVPAGPALTVRAGMTRQSHVDIRALALGADIAGLHDGRVCKALARLCSSQGPRTGARHGQRARTGDSRAVRCRTRSGRLDALRRVRAATQAGRRQERARCRYSSRAWSGTLRLVPHAVQTQIVIPRPRAASTMCPEQIGQLGTTSQASGVSLGLLIARAPPESSLPAGWNEIGRWPREHSSGRTDAWDPLGTGARPPH